MREFFILVTHLLVTIARLGKPGGARAIVAENLLLKQQLLVACRSRQRAPRLSALDRLLFGWWSLFLSTRRISRAAVLLKPATLLRFHAALVQRKYHQLFTPRTRAKPGPNGPSQELIHAIVEMKRRNPRFGCPRIAQQIAYTFGIEIDKDVVRRVLAKHYHPGGGTGPSWLTVIGHAKDSLWSVDLFCCESIRLQTHWILVVMDQFTRRIIGFAVKAGDVDGRALCCLFNQAISQQGVPNYLSADNDPLFLYHQWQANLRILEVEEIKTVPYVPLSHPFVERLIGTIRREFLDHVLFWNATDLQRKLDSFRHYYHRQRVHTSCDGRPPAETMETHATLNRLCWQPCCHGLYQLPIAV
jgi:transposase InsO family protein